MSQTVACKLYYLVLQIASNLRSKIVSKSDHSVCQSNQEIRPPCSARSCLRQSDVTKLSRNFYVIHVTQIVHITHVTQIVQVIATLICAQISAQIFSQYCKKLSPKLSKSSLKSDPTASEIFVQILSPCLKNCQEFTRVATLRYTSTKSSTPNIITLSR